MPANFTELETEVASLEEVVPSAVALLNGFEQLLLDAIAADNLSDDSNTALFAKRVGSQKNSLAAAVAARTPGEPAPE